jgi:hypothetical protein
MKQSLYLTLAVMLAMTASCTKTDPLVKDNNHPVVKPEAVDLGIQVGGKPIKWASFNLGATNECEYGNYYAWGETVTKKDGYNWNTYSYANAVGTEFTKYCLESQDEWWAGTRNADNAAVLKSSDDAAKKNLKGKWRMPTLDEVLALLYTQKLSNYKWEYEEAIDEDYNEVKNVYGNTIYGVRITYKDTGASIFLPLGGRIIDKSPEEVNELGYYWTSSLSTGEDGGPDGAYCLGLEIDEPAGRWSIGRYYGALVRPVYVEEE